MRITWGPGGSFPPVPQLQSLSGGWAFLAAVPGLLPALAALGKDPIPEQVAQALDELGFVDRIRQEAMAA